MALSLIFLKAMICIYVYTYIHIYMSIEPDVGFYELLYFAYPSINIVIVATAKLENVEKILPIYVFACSSLTYLLLAFMGMKGRKYRVSAFIAHLMNLMLSIIIPIKIAPVGLIWSMVAWITISIIYCICFITHLGCVIICFPKYYPDDENA